MNFYALLLTLLISTGALAQATAQPDFASLKDVMSQMRSLARQISIQSIVPSQNPSSAALSDQLAKTATQAKNFTPDSVASLPANEQAAAHDQYNKLIDQSVEQAKQLQTAFLANDNRQANTLLKQLDASRKEGHNQFK